MALTLSVGVQVASTKTAAAGRQTKADTYSLSTRAAFTDGTGSSSANKHWTSGEATLGGSASTYDLAGALTNGIGEAVVFAKVKVLVVRALSTNAGNVTIGGGSNAWAALYGSTLILPPGTDVAIKTSNANGWAVTAGTGDIVQVAGTSGDKFELFVAGE
jgi:hypothetical protein